MLFKYYSLQTTNSYTLLYTQLKRDGKLEVSFCCLLFVVNVILNLSIEALFEVTLARFSRSLKKCTRSRKIRLRCKMFVRVCFREISVWLLYYPPPMYQRRHVM